MTTGGFMDRSTTRPSGRLMTELKHRDDFLGGRLFAIHRDMGAIDADD